MLTNSAAPTCDKCGAKMILLLLTAVCDTCDSKSSTGSSELTTGYIAFRTSRMGLATHVFDTREGAEKWLSVISSGHKIRKVQTLYNVPWVDTQGAVVGHRCSSNPLTVFEERRCKTDDFWRHNPAVWLCD